MKRRSQIMWVALLMLLVVTLGGARRGYAGAGEVPPGSEEIRQPQLRGKLIAMYDPDNNRIAATIAGYCKREPFFIGPIFLTPLQSFAEAVQEDELEGFSISRIDFPGLVDLPEGCFSRKDTLQGLVIHDVVRFLFRTPRLVIAKVVVLGVRLPL